MGSPPTTNTIGIVEVAAFAASGEGTLPRATIAATCLWTKSDANAWRRSYRPSAQRYSIATFSCSKKPSSLRPCLKAANISWLSPKDLELRTPMRGTAVCCACVADGHATAASPAMPPAFSFDNLVGTGEEGGREAQSEHVRRLEIEHELHFGRLLDRQLGRFRSLKDPVDKARRARVEVGVAHAVGQQAAVVREFARWIDGRQPVARGKPDDEWGEGLDEVVDADRERVGTVLHRALDSRGEIVRPPNVDEPRPEPERLGHPHRLLPLRRRHRIAHVEESADAGRARHRLLDQLHALALQLGNKGAEPGDVAARPRELGDHARTDRLADRRHYDRDALGRVLRRERGRGPSRDDEIDPGCNELGRDFRKPRHLAVRRPVLDVKV